RDDQQQSVDARERGGQVRGEAGRSGDEHVDAGGDLGGEGLVQGGDGFGGVRVRIEGDEGLRGEAVGGRDRGRGAVLHGGDGARGGLDGLGHGGQVRVREGVPGAEDDNRGQGRVLGEVALAGLDD